MHRGRRRVESQPATSFERDVVGRIARRIGTLMAFVIVSLGIVVLRRTRPDLPRPFRMPMVPLLPTFVLPVAQP